MRYCFLRITLFSITWALSLPLAAFAQDAERTKVGVFPVQAIVNLPVRELRSFSNQFSQKLDASNELLIVRKFPLVGGVPPAPPKPINLGEIKQKEIDPIKKAIQAGKAKLEEQAFDDAIKPLREAVKLAATHIRWDESFPLLADAMASLALSYLQLGRNDIGESLLKNLARLAPNPLPETITRSRPLSFRYKRAVREVASGKRADLQLIGTSGAIVFVNGEQKGKLPLKVSDLQIGYHYVRVVASGYLPDGRAIKLTEGLPPQQFDLKPATPVQRMTPMQAASEKLRTQISQKRWDAAPFLGAARDICEDAGIAVLVTALIEAKDDNHHSLIPIRFDCRAQRAEILASIPIQTELQDGKDVLAKAVPLLFPPPKPVERRVAVLVTRPPVPSTPKATPVHQTWWFWTIIGVAVVGGGATAAYFLLQPPKMTFSASWNPNFGQ